MKKDDEPKFPELLDCPVLKGSCAFDGCYIENAIKRIDKIKLGTVKARCAKSTLIDLAFDCKCKKAAKLISQR